LRLLRSLTRVCRRLRRRPENNCQAPKAPQLWLAIGRDGQGAAI